MPEIYRRIRFFSQVFGILVMCSGVLVLFGWVTGIEFLKRVRPQAVAMNPVTAICFIAAGWGLYLVQVNRLPKWIKTVRWLAGFIFFIGALKLFSLFTNLPLPFDQILFEDQLWERTSRANNVIAPNTALNLLLVALSLWFIDYETPRGRRPGQYFSIVLSLLALVSLYGHVYQITALFRVATYLPMAFHTAMAFLLLGAGFLFSRPDKGILSIIIGENSGQVIFLRFLALLLPLIFGWFRLQGETAGLYDKEFGTALFAVLTYAIAMFLLGRQSFLQHKIRQTRKMAMDAIKENERRLQAILDHSGTLISLKNPEGRYTLVNNQFEKAFGISEGHALGKTDAELFPKEIVKELHEYNRKVLEFRKSQSFEEKYPHKDGVHTYVTVKFPLFDQDEEIYALGAVSTDITKRKQLEVELRRSHQRLFAILDNIGEGVMVADSEGNIILFNKRAEEILGTGAVMVPWEDWSKTYGFFQADGTTYFSAEEFPLYKAIHGDAADSVEIYIRNDKFGESGKWIAFTGRPVFNDEAEIIAGVVVFRDISIRKNLEGLFQENQRRLRAILSSIGEGVIIMSREEEILLFNKKAEEILGYGPKSIPVNEWPEYYGIYEVETEKLFPAEELPLARALRGLNSEEVEVLIRNKYNPEGKRIFLNGKPIRDNEGEITGGIIDLKDITEQRKLEEYLHEIQDQFMELLHSTGRR
ncbi:PAS domain S-box protein [Adhaeribacter soli]|nr:PAS domain S-box protein [Adhaeribacter soli]